MRDWLTRPPTTRVRGLYVRGIGLVHVIAFASLWWQIQGLVGSDGIVPFAELFASAEAQIGPDAGWSFPGLLWWFRSDGALHLVCAAGVLLGGAVLLGAPYAGPQLLALAGLYLSVSSAGWVFLRFQWDTLLVETSVVAAFVGSWRWHPREPSLFAWVLHWWLLFRLMFFAGWVKLASGDPTWANFTALDVHFWTQPLPNPLSRVAHAAPRWLHQALVGFTFAVELVLPFAILAGRRGRLAVFVGFTALMLGLATTGNYGFFQLLSIVLAISVLDDHHLPGKPSSGAAPPASWPSVALGSGLVVLSLIQIARPAWGTSVLAATAPLRIVNRYGLFATMTTDRPEILLEGSTDGRTWRPLPLRYKPGALDRPPPQVAPHMPRLDWQMWFAALGTCRRNPWLVRLMQEVANGNPRMDSFFVAGTFDEDRPTRVRAIRARYTFTDLGHDDVWSRTRLGPYCPVRHREGR